MVRAAHDTAVTAGRPAQALLAKLLLAASTLQDTSNLRTLAWDPQENLLQHLDGGHSGLPPGSAVTFVNAFTEAETLGHVLRRGATECIRVSRRLNGRGSYMCQLPAVPFRGPLLLGQSSFLYMPDRVLPPGQPRPGGPAAEVPAGLKTGHCKIQVSRALAVVAWLPHIAAPAFRPPVVWRARSRRRAARGCPVLRPEPMHGADANRQEPRGYSTQPQRSAGARLSLQVCPGRVRLLMAGGWSFHRI